MIATNLPAINPRSVGASDIPTVDARELHAFLCVKRDFSNWIKGRIAKYEFIEGVDFVSYEGFPPDLAKTSGGRPPVEYALSLRMAKELSMVENNAKGREARRYFIAKEEAYDATQSVGAPAKQLAIEDMLEAAAATIRAKNVTIRAKNAQLELVNAVVVEYAVENTILNHTIRAIAGDSKSILIEEFANKLGLYHHLFIKFCKTYEAGGNLNRREYAPRKGKQLLFETFKTKATSPDGDGRYTDECIFEKVTPYGQEVFINMYYKGEFDYMIKTDLRLIAGGRA
jgi:phage anti-repressor protein